jgi:hypothetical protein
MFAVLGWEAFKDWLSASTGLTHHDYHVLLGIVLTLGLTWLLRRPLGSWLPLLIVLALELLNEASDFTRYYVAGWPWEPEPTLVDIALTMAAPLVIVTIARLTSFAPDPSASALANRRDNG